MKEPHMEPTASDFDGFEKNDLVRILLHYIQINFITGIKIILDTGILQGYWLDPAVWEAICRGDREILEILCSKGAKPDKIYILTALERKHWHVAKFLAERGFYNNPNFCLPMCVECPELVEYFLKKGAHSDYIQSALKETVLKRCKRSAEILLEHGASPTSDLIPHMSEIKIGIFGL